MSKGIPLLLDAISKLRSLTQKSFSVKIMGSGSRLEDFKRMSIDMGLGSIVEFLGWIAKPADIFDNSHIAVFSSLWQEPFGLSGIEAMSRGIPVVAFDVGGVPEWLKNNYNGILVPERDTYAMAKALANLIDNNTLRQTLGVNARKSVIENYTEEKFLKNFIQLA
jgi:glycosyltransferase involved in cell wall biosynthesis